MTGRGSEVVSVEYATGQLCLTYQVSSCDEVTGLWMREACG